jgi:hypothetical protein
MSDVARTDGGQAFSWFEDGKGMSVRDYFAGQALIGVIVARSAAGLDILQESIAEECFELADAMIAARMVVSDGDSEEIES